MKRSRQEKDFLAALSAQTIGFMQAFAAHVRECKGCDRSLVVASNEHGKLPVLCPVGAELGTTLLCGVVCAGDDVHDLRRERAKARGAR